MNTKPKPEVKFRVNGLVELQNAFRKFADPYGLVQSCMNCNHFDEDKSYCRKYQANPPPRVIAYACPGYDDVDDIPF